MMLAPRLTWIALGVGIVALLIVAYPFVAALMHQPNPFTRAFGQAVGHQMSLAFAALAGICQAVAAAGRSIAPAVDAGRQMLHPATPVAPVARPAAVVAAPRAPSAPTPAPTPAPKGTPLVNLFQSLLTKFIAPEERAIGAAIAAAYAANKPVVVAALQAKGATAVSVLKADADAFVAHGFSVIPDGSLLFPILAPTVDASVNALIDRLVASAGGEVPIIEAYADSVVAAIVAALEAA